MLHTKLALAGSVEAHDNRFVGKVDSGLVGRLGLLEVGLGEISAESGTTAPVRTYAKCKTAAVGDEAFHRTDSKKPSCHFTGAGVLLAEVLQDPWLDKSKCC